MEKTLRLIAQDFNVDVEVVRTAVDRATASTNQLPFDVITRLQVATAGLLRELGGRASLRAWSRQTIPALADVRPLDILAQGNVLALERVTKVLATGVFS